MRQGSRPKIIAFVLAGICLAATASLAEAQSGTNGHDGGLMQAATERATGFDEARNVAGGLAARQGARKNDSVLNGLLIGAGVGALLGLIPDYYDDCEECHDSLYVSIAVGAGVGLLVDLLRRERPAVSPSRSDQPFKVGVAIAPGSIGVGGRLRWRRSGS